MRVTRTQKLIRAAFHIPLGVLQGFALQVSGIAALTFCLTFLTYEVIEDWRIRDKSYNDVIGYLIGLGAYIVVRLLVSCE